MRWCEVSVKGEYWFIPVPNYTEAYDSGFFLGRNTVSTARYSLYRRVSERFYFVFFFFKTDNTKHVQDHVRL